LPDAAVRLGSHPSDRGDLVSVGSSLPAAPAAMAAADGASAPRPNGR